MTTEIVYWKRPVLLTCMAVAALIGCDVDKTQEGRMPEVEVTDEGQLPKYDVDGPEVEVGTTTKEVEVPDVDVDVHTEKKQMEVPTVDVKPPTDDDVE